MGKLSNSFEKPANPRVGRSGSIPGVSGTSVTKASPIPEVYEDRKDYLRQYQKGWAKSRREAWLQANGPCKQCGMAGPLELDHVDPAKKVSHRVWSWTALRRDAELKKCQALCRPCHKVKTRAYVRRLMTGKRGVALKLSPEIVEAIYREAKAGGKPRAMGRRYGISHSTVIHIRDGKEWRWLTSKLDQAPKAEQLGLFKEAA